MTGRVCTPRRAVLAIAPLGLCASVLHLLACASAASASVRRPGPDSSARDSASITHRSLAAATLGAPCRYGGNIMPVDCSPGLKCQPDASTAVASEPTSEPNPNPLARPGNFGAGPQALTNNPDFATTGKCVPDDSSTSSSSPSTSAPSNATSPSTPNSSIPRAPSSGATSVPSLGPGPLEKPSTCAYMCAKGQYHGDMPCPRGYTCVLALEGGVQLPPETLESLINPLAMSAALNCSNISDTTAGNRPITPMSNASNVDFIKSTGGVIPYEGICAPSQWFGPNVSPDLLSAPTSAGSGVSARAVLGGSGTVPAAKPAAGKAGSNCSFGGEGAAVLCNQGYACLVEVEKRTVNHPLVHGVCVSVALCDPYLEEKIEDEAKMGSSGNKSAGGGGGRLPGLGGHRLWIAVLLFGSLMFL
ncbi:hypothetical protein CLOM_g12423 [Closterium sp. NIES-68]|nr:hypothetical protein CLOM_g12423 [Closterium sp. NIES-68]GJP72490.1 hypothetical protein CLOP_g3220 [Closterium sp. NIES-67]